MGHGQVWVISGGRRTLVILKGDIDVSVQAELAQAVQQAELAGAQVQLDACAVTFLDSVGITALARLAIRTPAPMIVFGASDTVRFLLEVTDLSDRVEFWPDADPRTPLRPLRGQKG